jgi:uncharacterized protein
MWWETTKLEDMDQQQWESLCDGCGRCCLKKAWRGNEIEVTRIACRLMDVTTASCSDYHNRQQKVHECIKLHPGNVGHPLLPKTCAYLLIHQGKPLEWWHPLVSGRQETVMEAGISIIGDIKHTERTMSLAKMALFRALERPIP